MALGASPVVARYACCVVIVYKPYYSVLRVVVQEPHDKSTKKTGGGNLKMLCSTTIKIVVWIIMLVCAAGLGIACFIGAVILWGRGLYGVFRWVHWRSSKKGMSVSGEIEDSCPKVMPGQEKGSHWNHAWTIAKSGNRRIRDDRDSAHFNVGPLLKSTTGLEMKSIALLIRMRHESSKRKDELHEVDRKAAGGRAFPSRVGTSDKVQVDNDMYTALFVQDSFVQND